MKTKVVNKIIRNKDPYKNKITREAHEYADELEKKRFPKGYQEMKRIDSKLKNKHFSGENYGTTKEVSREIPKKDRKETLFHEGVELKKKRQLRAKKHA